MAMTCPHDGSELKPGQIHNITVAECATCHGAWFELAALEELERSAAKDQAALAGTIEFLETEDTLRCPSCGKPMQRFDYRAHDLQLDACDAEHGFWVDAGKADRVREIMQQREADVRRSESADRTWQQEREAGFKPTLLSRMKGLFGGR